MTFAIQVIPGYQGMNDKQRDKLLRLCERSELHRTVYVRELAGARWCAWDTERTFIINPDGEHERILK